MKDSEIILSTGEQTKILLSEEDQRSADILNSFQNSDFFRKEGDYVQLYKDSSEGLKPTIMKFPVKDFLSAVDYYQDNRVSEHRVDLEMQKPDGLVEVYSPIVEGGGERHVVARIKNYHVPQILEFAYLLVRSEQKKDK